jgi:hypothetical protein
MIREQIEVARKIESEEEALYDETEEYDGQLYERFTVHNQIHITIPRTIRGFNPQTETYSSEATIETDVPGETPQAVTKSVANTLWHEHTIDDLNERFGIEVVDIEENEDILRV